MDRLSELLKHVSEEKLPPVHLWNPELCGNMDLVIRSDGRWIHEGTEITRQKLVKLFSSILKLENDEYFLVTPVEKVRIQVENTPFIVASSELIDETWTITNNLGDTRILNRECNLDLSDDQNPVLVWRGALKARVNQNVMYQWQMYAIDNQCLDEEHVWLNSGEDKIPLGSIE